MIWAEKRLILKIFTFWERLWHWEGYPSRAWKVFRKPSRLAYPIEGFGVFHEAVPANFEAEKCGSGQV